MAGPFREPKKFDLIDLRVLTSGYDRDFDFAVTLAARATRAPFASFVTVDMDARLCRARAWTGFGPDGPKVREVPLEGTLLDRLILKPELIMVSDIARDYRTAGQSALRSNGVQSCLAAPVLCPAEKVVGMISVGDRLPRLWNDEDAGVLKYVAHFCTQVILLRAALKTLSLISQDTAREDGAA
jgi:GAF domain-containing protein